MVKNRKNSSWFIVHGRFVHGRWTIVDGKKLFYYFQNGPWTFSYLHPLIANPDFINFFKKFRCLMIKFKYFISCRIFPELNFKLILKLWNKALTGFFRWMFFAE